MKTLTEYNSDIGEATKSSPLMPTKANKETTIKHCTVKDCEKLIKARGYCSMHLWRLTNHGDALWVKPSKINYCKEPACTKRCFGQGWCSTHYQRLSFRGTCTIAGCSLKLRSKDLCNTHLLRRERNGDPLVVKRVYTEQRKKHPLYDTYMGMVQRCEDQNTKSYHNYGGRGIKICSEWRGAHGFSQFVVDMGEKPDNMTLDRIDPNDDYKASNCRWSSWRVQSINQRPRKGSLSGVRGVHFNKYINQWVASVRHDGRTLRWTYTSMQEAINKRKWAEDKYYKPLMENT